MKGKVHRIHETDYQGIKLHSFQLENDGTFWRMGRHAPEFEEGEWIEFDAADKNVNHESITRVKADATSTASQKTTDVGARMRYQAARRDACNIVVAALHTDHLPHAANVAKAKRLALLEGYVEQVTKTLLAQEDENVTNETK